MKKKKTFMAGLLGLFALVILGGLVASSALGASGAYEKRFVSNDKGANGRLGPGLKYDKDFRLENNTIVDGRKEGAWFKFDKQGYPLYLSYKLTLPYEKDMETRYVAVSRANVRSKKSVSSAMVKKLTYDAKLLGVREGAWFKIYMNKKPVYLAYSLTKAKPAQEETRYIKGEGIKIRSSPKLGNNVLARAYTNRPVQGIRRGSWFEFSYKGKPAYIAYSWTDDYRQDVFFIKEERMAVRASRDDEGRILGWVHKGDSLVGNAGIFWFKFDYRGKTGYIYLDHLAEEPFLDLDFKSHSKNYLSDGSSLDYGRFSSTYLLRSEKREDPDLEVKKGSELEILDYRKNSRSLMTYRGKNYLAPRGSFSYRSLKLDKKILEDIPLKHKRFIRGVNVASSWKDQVAGEYRSDLRLVRIEERFRTSKATLYHELGHSIASGARLDGKRQDQDRLWKSIWAREWEGHDYYGAQDELEAFSEAFTAYQLGFSDHFDGDFRKEKPYSYAYMEELEKELDKYQEAS